MITNNKYLCSKFSTISISLVVLILIYSFFVEPKLVISNVVQINSEDLSKVLHNKKVVHISDLHISSIGMREKNLSKKLNEIMPDLLFITGDFLEMGKGSAECLEFLQKINPPQYGIWAVMGNTDRFDKYGINKNINSFISKLNELGVHVLEDACVQLFLNDDDFVSLAGIEGVWLSRSKLDWLLKNVAGNSPVILLSHYPDVFEQHPDALSVNLEEMKDFGVSGWGWQDNSYFEHDVAIVQFEKDGPHTIRVQRREDGVSIHQICLVAVSTRRALFTDSKCMQFENSEDLYSAINPHSNEMIIIKAEDIPESNIFGSWQKLTDPGLNNDCIITDKSDANIKNEFPLSDPDNYFEAEFYSEAGIEYHVWIRMKAEGDSISNDSVYVQFSDAVDSQGVPIFKIGETGIRPSFKEIDLILAGHTHGGQIRFPLIGSFDIFPDYNLRYDLGLFEKQETKMYVNRGIGTSILRARFFCPPEITIFQFTPLQSIRGNAETSSS